MALPIEILVGSTAGNTEYLATEIEQKLNASNHTTQFHDFPKWEEINFNATFLLCIATHGAGEYAESIVDFMEHLEHRQPDLTHLKFALIAIGDSSYDTYCSAGIKASELLQRLGAKEISSMLKIDMQITTEPEKIALEWIDQISWP
ncbi:flavodoxin domain-containing protein [Aliidiomarina quisquiliarum]|uniref:flavodoxin domain-containing protein n=1 Tax=Aliidiomarina quisquiliarum TaxID=2938947 RepID=UPI00208F5DB5|nr:flavodoxin domain-containing protein [Aliidiomarina quisquiliarum]MCO4321262.1 flavodoxin domain-containing protein [Aliidiomarina quisquiliarum]